MGFTLTPLVGNEVLVEGTDIAGNAGHAVLDGGQWDTVKRTVVRDEAVAEFDAAVDQLFAPIREASEAYNAATRPPEADPLLEYVVVEGSPATPGTDRIAVPLTKDSVILRLIEQDPSTNRLRWLDGNRLVVTSTIQVSRQEPEVDDEDQFIGSESAD